MRPLEPDLRAGLEALSLPLDGTQIAHCLDYLDLLAKWGKVYNLTALRDPKVMLTHHILDSLSVIAPLRRQLTNMIGAGTPGRLLDVGSGAGLPGAVIAICCPELAVTCVDAVAKKAAFIQQAGVTLRLPNLRGVHARVESIQDQAYDIVCSRAFAALADFTAWSYQALAPGGVWMAMKGKHPQVELDVMPREVSVFHVEQLKVPEVDADRCIVWMRPTGA